MSIHSSTERSPQAFLSVPYRDHWFWIDDRDLTSKRNFAMLMMLFDPAATCSVCGVYADQPILSSNGS